MSRSQRRLMMLFLAVPVLLVLSAGIYMWGMAELEGERRGFWDAFGWAGETITTTGYGGDYQWDHPAMVLYVVLLQFIGVFLVFLVFPIYVIPFLEERFETRLPTEAGDVEDHVVIYRYGPAVTSLVERLAEAGLDSVLLEPDSSVARRLAELGRRVVARSLDDGGLEAARIGRARALIANGRDDENAAVILAARQRGFTGEVIALVEEPLHRKPMQLAGADAVYTPRHILGAALAARASARISPRLSGVQQLGRKLAVREIRVQPGSRLAGRSLAEAAIGAQTGATVIAQWVEGELRRQPTAQTRLVPSGILVAVGSDDALERLADLAGAVPLRQEGPFLIGGFGEVGRKVAQLLGDAGEAVVVVDKQGSEGVDRVGDVLDPELLERAGVRAAQAVVLALDTDAATLFATVIVKDVAPAVPVIARVNQAENVERIHRAGADFALSISQVSGQMLARRLLGEEAVSIDPLLKVRRVAPDGLVGKNPAELRLRARTGCSVVAVERGEDVVVTFGPEFRFADGDAVYLCGSGEAVDRFPESLGTG
jgi:Trk K+ transport system NAD-binding subunit